MSAQTLQDQIAEMIAQIHIMGTCDDCGQHLDVTNGSFYIGGGRGFRTICYDRTSCESRRGTTDYNQVLPVKFTTDEPPHDGPVVSDAEASPADAE